MSPMIKKHVSELEGAQLDWAVAMAGEEWKTAHAHFPTMSLDSTFCGAFIVDRGSNKECWLKPNNPMRQDPQEFSPSTRWEHGGPIIERETSSHGHNMDRSVWAHCGCHLGEGKTLLIAAMRAFVACKLGDEVEVPA